MACFWLGRKATGARADGDGSVLQIGVLGHGYGLRRSDTILMIKFWADVLRGS